MLMLMEISNHRTLPYFHFFNFFGTVSRCTDGTLFCYFSVGNVPFSLFRYYFLFCVKSSIAAGVEQLKCNYSYQNHAGFRLMITVVSTRFLIGCYSNGRSFFWLSINIFISCLLSTATSECGNEIGFKGEFIRFRDEYDAPYVDFDRICSTL